MLGKETRILVDRFDLVEETVICAETKKEVSVWGVSVAFSDGTKTHYPDVCCDSDDINFIYEKLIQYDDIYKVHVTDIIEGLIFEARSDVVRVEEISA